MKKTLTTILLAATLAISAWAAPAKVTSPEPVRVTYKTQNIEGLKIFYREAGSPSRPTIVLLHGFPSSSHMFRELIPKLANQYHVIAADMPGYGYSGAPPLGQFEYTFTNLTNVMDSFLDSIAVTKYSIYVMDYGSPVGFRLFAKHPERIQAIVSQNGNAYEEGLSPFWAEYATPYWNEKNAENEKRVRSLVTIELTKFQYSKGFRSAENVSPDSYTLDQLFLDRPGNADIQVAIFGDYASNVKLYPKWHELLRQHQPALLAVWGKNDPIFSAAGAEAFKRDLPKAEIHFLDTGHFALEEDCDAIANYMLAFLGKNVK